MIDLFFNAFVYAVGEPFFFVLLAFVILATLFDALFERYLP